MTDRPKRTLSDMRRRGLVACAVLLAAGGAVIGAVYGISGIARNAADAECAAAVAVARRITPDVHGEVAALALAEKPFRVPDLAFKDETGQARHLSDWRGRSVLLNLWATWCIPCRREMPALDALQVSLGGPQFEVVAINIDTRDPEKPRAFLRDAAITQLGYYVDPSAKVFQDLKLVGKAFGMPTTLLVDPKGCEIGTMAGPAEWASEDGRRLVSAALAN